MDDLNKRIERLEDAQAFGDHAKDQLSEQLLRAYEQITRLTRRLEALERRLGSLEEPEAEGDA